MGKLTILILFTLAMLLGSGSTNASEHCEDTSSPDYDASECDEASSGNDQKSTEVPKQFGGIGFPSGSVKNSDLVKLVLGNTIWMEYSNYGVVTRHIQQGGKVNLCVENGKRCTQDPNRKYMSKETWAVQDGRFCLKHPKVNSGLWWCLIDANYNDKTGSFTPISTATSNNLYFKVYRGDYWSVDKPKVQPEKSKPKKVISQTTATKKTVTPTKKTVESSSDDQDDIKKLERKLKYLKERKSILNKIKSLKTKLQMFQKKLEVLKLEYETEN